MLRILSLTVKNFLPIGNATQALRLDQHGLTLILGSNTDANGGVTRNGAGKTAILQAISYILYGKPLTKIKVDNLINNINGKAMLGTLEFESDGVRCRIERGRKPNILRFFVDGREQSYEEDVSQGENSQTQEHITRIIGMTHTLFSHIVALNTSTTPFLLLKAADQRAVMEELIAITDLSERADALRVAISGTKDEIRDLDATIKAQSASNDRIALSIEQARLNQRKFENERHIAMTRLHIEIETMEGIDYEEEIRAFDALDAYREVSRSLKAEVSQAENLALVAQKDVLQAKNAIAMMQRELDGVDPAKALARLAVDADRKSAMAKNSEGEVLVILAEIAALEAQVASADDQICRCCNQRLSGTDHLAKVIQNLESDIAMYRERVVEAETRTGQFRLEAQAILDEAAEVEATSRARKVEIQASLVEAEEAHQTAVVAHREAKDAADRARASLDVLGPIPETIFETRDEVYKARSLHETLTRELEHERAKANPFTVQITSLEETIQPIDPEPLRERQDHLKHQELLLKLLTNKDSFIRKKIIDQNLHLLNTRLAFYLDKLGLPHQVTFQPDLTVDIEHLGRDFDFEQLSRGEMNRVIMSTSWAFRDVWESLNKGINIYFVDEVLDQGTDSHGAEAALKVLTGMARERGKNIFLISHRDDLVGRIDRTLLVRKDAGFARFEEDVAA